MRTTIRLTARISLLSAQAFLLLGDLLFPKSPFSYEGGTEAWYLARYVRGQGFVARFEFDPAASPAVGCPAVLGVRLGGCGHFIALLEIKDDMVTFVDPLIGEEHLTVSAFQRRYDFTGFHLVITKGWQ